MSGSEESFNRSHNLDYSLGQAHNNLAKRMFQDINNIISLLVMMLSDTILNKINFNSRTTRVDGVFVNSDLKESRADLVLEVEYGKKKRTLCILIEFKSYVDRDVVSQLNQYDANYKSSDREHMKNPVIQVLFYSGGKYLSEDELEMTSKMELDGDEELIPYQISRKLVFISLRDKKDSEIKGSLFFRIGMLSMKYSSMNVSEFIDAYFKMFKNYDPKKDGILNKEDEITCIRYIQGVRSKEDQRKIADIFNDPSVNTNIPLGGIMLTADELLERSLIDVQVELMRKDLEKEVREDLEKEVREDLEKEVREDLEKEVREDLEKELFGRVNKEILNIAKSLKSSGVDIDNIVKSTRLGKEIVENL